jgi:sortase A
MDKKHLLRLLAIICAISGFVIVLGILIPIVSYEITSRQKYPVLLSPVKTTLGGVLGWEIKDSTNIGNWFTDSKYNSEEIQNLDYSLSIPSLNIKNASVVIGGEDLRKHLIHFPGTALPGKIGNSVIFGHSVLPIFYNPSDYKTIFSKLPILKDGDLIEIDFDHVHFRYIVVDMFEVYPEDIQILEQEASDSYLTLVTCVPPGDPRMPRRLIVRAKILPFN